MSAPPGWEVPAGYTPGGPPGRCRSCKAEVLWVRTPAGRRMPIDRDGVSHFATCPDADSWRKQSAPIGGPST